MTAYWRMLSWEIHSDTGIVGYYTAWGINGSNCDTGMNYTAQCFLENRTCFQNKTMVDKQNQLHLILYAQNFIFMTAAQNLPH